MLITVIQFMRPNGRQVPQSVEIADDLKEKYELIRKCGCRLTAEVLMTGMVSQCIEHEDGDYDMELSQQNPFDGSAERKLEEMIRRFDEDKFRKWLEAVQGGEPPDAEDDEEIPF